MSLPHKGDLCFKFGAIVWKVFAEHFNWAVWNLELVGKSGNRMATALAWLSKLSFVKLEESERKTLTNLKGSFSLNQPLLKHATPS